MQEENKNLLDNQPYYLLSNGKQVKDITDFLCFNSGSATKYTGRAGKKDVNKEKEDIVKVLTFLKYLLDQEYLTSPFIDKLAGIKRLLEKRKTPKVEIDTIIKSIMKELQENIDCLVDGLESENRKLVIYYIYGFLVNAEEQTQRESLEEAVKYAKKALEELETEK